MAIPADRMLLLRKTTFNAGCSRKTSGEGLFSATFVLVLTTPVCHVGPGNATDTRATMIFNDECRVVGDPGVAERLALGSLRGS